jgi:hypothetical protein
MKKLILALTAVVLLVAFALAQSQTNQKRQPTRDKARPATAKEKQATLDEYSRQFDSDTNGTWRVATTNEGRIYFFNATKTMRSLKNDIVRVWIKERFIDSRAAQEFIDSYRGSEFDYSDYDMTIWLGEFNCKAHKVRAQTWVDSDSQGRVIFFDPNNETEWIDIVPDSVAEAIMQKVCSYKP